MVFTGTAVNIINLIFIGAGIGVCGLSFLQITFSTHLRKEIRRYFQIFFILIVLYVSTHLVRQILDGIPGSGVRVTLLCVTFVEMLVAGMMAHMMSMLVLTASRVEKNAKKLLILLMALLCLHAVLLIIGQFVPIIYYFDAGNVYHRASGYLLSNLSPFIMLVINACLLIRYRDNIIKRVRSAFWTYIFAPIAAMILQGLLYGVQFIIFASVGAAVYMFSVIIKDLNEKYETQKLESSRIETELTMASNIQSDMLPNVFPAFPERQEFDIYASMTPAKEVGGDFYDFFFTDDDHLGVVMADVSGKGVPAALFMMITMTLVQNYAMTGLSPGETLEAVNRQICANNREEMFVTVWFGLLDISTGKMVAANAGHEYPVIKSPEGSFELLKDKHSFVVGGMEGLKYKEYEIQLSPGGKLFLYTDGVAEATNASEELFGTDRMIDALRSAENGTPQQVLEEVSRAVSGFVKDAPQFDDLTMLCLEYKGPVKA